MIDPSSDAPRLNVVKEDGSVEIFSMSKLVQCIRCGLQAGGEPTHLDLPLAAGMAEAVYEFLRKTSDGRPVFSRSIADLVDQVLTQTGHTDAGLAIREFKNWRNQNRRRLLVASPRKRDGRFIQRRWKKTHLLTHLRRKQHLDAPVARMIGGRVEQLIFHTGLRVVTTGLVTEMVKSELLAWGLLPGALVVQRNTKVRNKRSVTDPSESG